MKPSILLQLDTDPQPSVFDAVVAIDAGVGHLLRHGGVTAAAVRELVFGALFTRGPADLHRTAIFVGGSDVAAAEAVLEAVRSTFFGAFRVSILFDANGSNTTAAAAVLAAIESCGGSVQGRRAVVLGGTGPVGQRVARLLAREGAEVALASRSLDRAREAADRVGGAVGQPVTPIAVGTPAALAAGLRGAEVVVAAGAPGVTLLPADVRRTLDRLKVIIDLNAVPPLGVEGVEATDRGADCDGVRAWGALGIGGTKMRIHKRAVETLFESSDRLFDAEACLEIGRSL